MYKDSFLQKLCRLLSCRLELLTNILRSNEKSVHFRSSQQFVELTVGRKKSSCKLPGEMRLCQLLRMRNMRRSDLGIVLGLSIVPSQY